MTGGAYTPRRSAPVGMTEFFVTGDAPGMTGGPHHAEARLRAAVIITKGSMVTSMQAASRASCSRPARRFEFGALARGRGAVQDLDHGRGHRGEVDARQRHAAAVDPDAFVEAPGEMRRWGFDAHRPHAQAVNVEGDRELLDEAVSAEFHEGPPGQGSRYRSWWSRVQRQNHWRCSRSAHSMQTPAQPSGSAIEGSAFSTSFAAAACAAEEYAPWRRSKR